MSFIQTVRGPLPASEAGFTLPHEHVMVDFIGAAETGPSRWDRAEVAEIMEPILRKAFDAGVGTIFECTPQYLARDPELLRTLSDRTGVHLVTNTGWYGAAGDRFLPPRAFDAAPAELAATWIAEWHGGIVDGIKPGFIKIGVDPGPLSEVDRKLVTAAALTHLETGLAIAVHTANAVAAFDIIAELGEQGVGPSAYICVHTDAEPDTATHAAIAEAGAWVEYDSVGRRPTEFHLDLVTKILDRHPDRLLLSHDSGWYNVGQPGGGQIRDYNFISESFLPALRQGGVADDVVHRLTHTNPATAFGMKG